MNLTIPEEFPISEKERRLLKKKLLIFITWCKNEEISTKWQQDAHAGIRAPWSCQQPCPLKSQCAPFLPYHFCLKHLINWIMEAEI